MYLFEVVRGKYMEKGLLGLIWKCI